MKKYVAIVLSIVIMLSLFGCGSSDPNMNATPDNGETAAVDNTAETNEENSNPNESQNATANTGESTGEVQNGSTAATEKQNNGSGGNGAGNTGGNSGSANGNTANNNSGGSISSGNHGNSGGSSGNSGGSSKGGSSSGNSGNPNNSNSGGQNTNNNNNTPKPTTPPAVDYGSMQMRILKIGASDAIMIKTSNNKTILIDAGSASDGDTVVQALRQQAITYLDYFIVTHFDKNHIGGAPAVINNIGIGTVIQPSYDRANTVYTAYANAISSKGVKTVSVNSNYSVSAGNIDLKIYPAQKSSYSDTKDNNFSMAISLIHGENKLLFVGDAMAARLQEIINMGNMRHDFVLMPRHGQYETNIEAFVNAVSPSYAGITCSAKNPEDSRVTQLLGSKGINYYLTRNGAISVVSDGKKLTVS